MNEPPHVRPTGQLPDPANSPLDALDDVILGQVRAAYDFADPPPTDLIDRVRFAIQLNNTDIEVSRLFADAVIGAGARAAERVRTITFEAESMTITLTVVDPGSGRLHVEGWLAPAAALRIELRVATTPDDRRGRLRTAVANEHGRFLFHDVPTGLAQIAVRRPQGEGRPTITLVTAPVTLDRFS